MTEKSEWRLCMMSGILIFLEPLARKSAEQSPFTSATVPKSLDV